jgi:hypothetical protein
LFVYLLRYFSCLLCWKRVVQHCQTNLEGRCLDVYKGRISKWNLQWSSMCVCACARMCVCVCVFAKKISLHYTVIVTTDRSSSMLISNFSWYRVIDQLLPTQKKTLPKLTFVTCSHFTQYAACPSLHPTLPSMPPVLHFLPLYPVCSLSFTSPTLPSMQPVRHFLPLYPVCSLSRLFTRRFRSLLVNLRGETFSVSFPLIHVSHYTHPPPTPQTLCMYICMCVCVCVYVCVCVCIYVCYVCMCVCVFVCLFGSFKLFRLLTVAVTVSSNSQQ